MSRQQPLKPQQRMPLGATVMPLGERPAGLQEEPYLERRRD